MKMFDYLATCRTILASELPVLHEILNDHNAVFCPPDDLNTWINTIKELANNQPRRDKLARQAGKDAGLYSWKNRASQTIAKLHKII